ELAHDNIKKCLISQHDTWLMATEITLADLRGRGSIFTKKGLQIVESNSFHPFNITELASSIGTLELNNSNLKKSKKLFEKSLIHPNDNSLAQAEWVSQEERGIMNIEPEKFQLINSFEALARDAKDKGNWEKAIELSKNWFLDLPFSKGGVLFGSEIARSLLKNHSKAVNIA